MAEVIAIYHIAENYKYFLFLSFGSRLPPYHVIFLQSNQRRTHTGAVNVFSQSKGAKPITAALLPLALIE